MILLLSCRSKPPIDPALEAIDQVKVFRATAPPRPLTDEPLLPGITGLLHPNWAFRRLEQARRTIDGQGVRAVVCAEERSVPFAARLAESHPGLPVLFGTSLAAATLSLLDDREIEVTRASVHDLLDPLHVSIPPIPAGILDATGGAPLVTMLVGGPVDPRTADEARALADRGLRVVVLAEHPEGKSDFQVIGGAVALRLPISPHQLQSQLDSPPRSLAAVLGYRSAGDALAARQRIDRALTEVGPGRRAPLTTRVAVRWTHWRTQVFERNRTSFTNPDQRRLAHRWRAAAWAAPWNPRDPEQAYPWISDFETLVASLTEALRPQVIHTSDPALLGVAGRIGQRLAGLGLDRPRIVHDAREWTPSVPRRHAYEGAALERIQRQRLASVDAITTTSTPLAERIRSGFPQAPPPVVVPDSPSSSRSSGTPTGEDVRRKAKRTGLDEVIVYVGSPGEGTGLDDVVAALERLPRASLVVVGIGPEAMTALRRQARSLGVIERLRRVDPPDERELPSFLATADLAVVPHHAEERFRVQLPRSVLTCLQARLPIVAADGGETAKLIRESGVGVVFPPGDADALGGAIRQALDQRQALRSAITDELLEMLSWERHAPSLVEVVEPLVGTVPAARGEPPPVLIGPANSAGQAAEWARALRDSGTPAKSLELRSSDNAFTHQVDVLIPRDAMDPLDRRVRLLLDEVLQARAVIMESARPIAAPEPGRFDPRTAGFREIRALRDASHVTGLMFHGSDLRRPDLHVRDHPWSPFADPAHAAMTATLVGRTRAIHAQLATWDGPVMVSTPDLIHQTPGACWVPVVVDLERFAFFDRPDADAPPVVVHMPSSAALKGTSLIDPVLHRLAGQGVIRYHQFQRIPHDRVADIMSQADIFVDQLGMGLFGVAPLEAMATGAVVVTDPGPEALEVYGEAVPIVPVDPTSLEAEVRALALDHARRAELARLGQAFTARHHDGRRSADAIRQALGLPESTG